VKQVVAILEVMWGWSGTERSRTKFFRINPDNHSGKRLIRLIGHDDFWVTNACPECVNSASDRGTPDAAWLRGNLEILKPTLVLVCGKVAQNTFEADMVDPATTVIHLRHPADRRWTREEIDETAARLKEVQRA
jgi:hypothetical protein